MYLEQIIEDLQRRIEQLETRQPIIEEWLTIREAAERLQVGESSLYRKVKSGEVYASTKTGRVRIPISQFYDERKPAADPVRIQDVNVPEDPRMRALYQEVWNDRDAFMAPASFWAEFIESAKGRFSKK